MNPVNPLWVIAVFVGALTLIVLLGRYLVRHADDEIDEILRRESCEAKRRLR